MPNLEAILQQLHQERTRAQSELERLNQAISALEGASIGRPTRGRKSLSPDARKRIAEAQRRRWAKVKGESAKTGKRTLSPAARRRIAAAQRARWAKFRAAKRH